MIEIKTMSKDFTKVERYMMTVSPDIQVIKDVPDDTTLEVTGWLEFDDIDERTGEVKNLLSIITRDRKAYSCQSLTFKNSLYDIINVVGAPGETVEFIPVRKFSGQNKSGRHFINCALDIETFENNQY
ncbi:MAG: hypothetical protein NC548_34040 [Lachnospiraceae bacterium]|nr:hypothetical protein [Lachnospiraceae bacterium]